MEHVTAADLADLAERAGRFAAHLEVAITEGGLGARATAVGPLVGLLVSPPGEHPLVPTDLGAARAAASSPVYARLFHALVARGVAFPPGPYEVLFPGLAHDDGHLDDAVAAAGDAASEVATHWS
jgi:glutamate-1-semialdehyde 2,1-aminomutase